MGTRNLTMVVLDGQTKVAQYCQWDGYPEGQGATVLEFLQNMNRERFVENLRKLKEFTSDQIQVLWENCGADKSGFVNMDISDIFKKRHPEFHRDTGAKILELIEQNKIVGVELSETFAADSLYCEWAYVIDLDKNVLEVYKGFNTKPVSKTSRFAHLKGDNGYEPIRLAKSYSLNNLPSQEQLNNLSKS